MKVVCVIDRKSSRFGAISDKWTKEGSTFYVWFGWVRATFHESQVEVAEGEAVEQ